MWCSTSNALSPTNLQHFRSARAVSLKSFQLLLFAANSRVLQAHQSISIGWTVV